MKTLAIISSVIVLSVPAMAFASGPSITLNGGSVTMQPGTSYSEPGYSAFDAIDGDITALVSVFNGIDGNQPGDYSVGYNVTDSQALSDHQTRNVTVSGWGAVSNPCNTNGTCPCPVSADIVSGNPVAWKACAVAHYPKLADGSTLVCRLKALQPQDNGVIQCAADQAGFGEMVIAPDGTETFR